MPVSPGRPSAPLLETWASDAELAAHNADTTSVHGITDTSALETTTGSAAKVTAHNADTTDVHGIADTSAIFAYPSGITAAGVYDQTRNVYNMHAGNVRVWRQALAAAKEGTAAAVLNCVGDSITYGPDSTSFNADGWPAILRGKIDTHMGAAGGTGAAWLWDTYGLTNDTRFTLTGSGVQVAGIGPFGKACLDLNTPGGTNYLQFGAVTADQFVVYYVNQTAGGGIYWSVDGGSETLIATNTSSTGGNTYATATVDAGSVGSHTLKLRPNSSHIYIVAVEALESTSGVRVSAVARPGNNSNDFRNTSTNLGWEYAITAMDPDLTLFMFGSNEYAGAATVANYETYMRTNVTRAQAVGDVAFVTTVPRDVASPASTELTFRQVAWTLADELDVPVIDVATRWGTTTLSGDLYAEAEGSRVHPNATGHRDIADAVYAAIMPH